MHNRLLNGGAWALAGRAASIAVNALTLPALSRLFSSEPAEFGLYLLAAGMSLLFAHAGAAGLNLSVVRHAAVHLGSNRPAAAAAVIRTSLWLAAAGGSVAGALFCLGVSTLPLELCGDFRHHHVAGIIGLWIVLQAMGLVLADAFRAFHDIRLAVAFGGLASNALFAAILMVSLLVNPHPSLQEVLSMAAIGWGASFAIGAMCLVRRLRRLTAAAADEPACAASSTELLRESLPLMVSSVIMLATMQIDLWVVGWYYAADESRVALYGAAARLVGLVGTALVVVNAVIPPMVAELHAHRRMRPLEQLLRGTATLAGVPASLALLAMIFAAGPMLGTVYGPYYRDAAPILMILSCGYLVFTAGGSAGITLMMTGHAKASMAINVVSVVLLLIGTVVAVPHGTIAVACVMSFTMAAQKIAMLAWVRWNLGIWTQLYFPPTWSQLRQTFAHPPANTVVESAT
ncbi:MAG TPA: hypothetical protein VHZ24_10620 [Pirellulales bacterium]|nr:hypothetical protein [Pirellulales bacterium]